MKSKFAVSTIDMCNSEITKQWPLHVVIVQLSCLAAIYEMMHIFLKRGGSVIADCAGSFIIIGWSHKNLAWIKNAGNTGIYK